MRNENSNNTEPLPVRQGMLDYLFSDEEGTWVNRNAVLQEAAANTMDVISDEWGMFA